MIEIIYIIIAVILVILLFIAVISLKKNKEFLVESIEKKELMIKDLENKLKDAVKNLETIEIEKSELISQLEIKSELLSQQNDKNENLLKLIKELQKVKPQKEEDVIIEYFLKKINEEYFSPA